MTIYTTHCIQLLERTPAALQGLLVPLHESWTHCNEGGTSWNVQEVVKHLVYCEITNWMPRVTLTLSDSLDRQFPPLDRTAQPKPAHGTSLPELLDSFAELRSENMLKLRELALNEDQLERTAEHPEFGSVTLSQLLATWTVHDLDHLAQIARIMAYQYKEAVGPWKAYLRIVRDNITL